MMAVRRSSIFLHCCNVLLFLVLLILLANASVSIPGNPEEEGIQTPPDSVLPQNFPVGIIGREGNARRLLIGSAAPVCTYNECRGCRNKCSAEQVPVNANDPVNSAYHYKCVCHW